MPFTVAHPALVVPLARGPLSLLALASGAMAPDLPYYLRSTPLPVTAESWYEPYVNATASHSLTGLITVALPLALVVYLCGAVARPPLRWAAGMPPRIAAASGPLGSLRAAAWIIAALLIGVLTHLAWDELTERGGSGSRLLQHGSTAVGMLVLVLLAWRQRAAICWQDAATRRRLLAAAVPCAVAALTSAVIAAWPWLRPPPGLGTGDIIEGIVTDAAKGAGFGLAAAAAVLVIAWWVAHRLDRRGPETRAPRPPL